MHPLLSEAKERLYSKLYQDLGDKIIGFLKDKDVHEIMLNPDGKCWIDHALEGLLFVCTLTEREATAIIQSIAGIHGCIVTKESPRLEAKLPFYKELQGERFTAQIPPIVPLPSFTIRKRSEHVFRLLDYIGSDRLTLKQLLILRELIRDRKNILVCGGPGSGKTTVTNALIVEAVQHNPNQRFVILEDLPELQCEAENCVSLVTSEQVDLQGLLRSAMRMRPDRILVGEVRGREALDMLKAWNTGCPGGICTVHANSALDAIQRIVDLAMESQLTSPPLSLVSHTIDAIVSVVRKGSQKGFIQEILSLGAYQDGQFTFTKLG
ncbi:MAG: P-type conjugative transfer ATPase TrbB [Proteobacteria bacterium]|nr:P-type conjugative transfer ATPase TrbB [Pseudomonadota bacterium]